ncbi:hypothetical protein GCM10027160_36750 [Streptomyces calidiresistens]
MIAPLLRRAARSRVTAPAALLAVLLAGSAAPAAHAAPAPVAPPTPAVATAVAAPAAVHPAAACPVVEDRLYAAAVRDVDLQRITPEPTWRTDCRKLYRADRRAPSVIFEEGFRPWDTVNGQYDLYSYTQVNQPSPFVSTTYDHDLYKYWWTVGWNYYIDAPGGIDVNGTIGDDHRWAEQVEVAFPGGVDRSFVAGGCPVDPRLRIEIMSQCRDNPHYEPWRTRAD